LSDVGLTDGRNNQPNASFACLVGLALGGRFGSGPLVSNKDKARKYKLCRALKQLIGVRGDPFHSRSPTEGYSPHFTIEDRRDDANQRAMRNRPNLGFDEDHK